MTRFKPLRAAFLACATLALALAAGPAFAHAKLLSEVPTAEDAASAAAPAQAAPVTELRLTFSEGLNAAFSKAGVKDSTGTAVAGAIVALDPSDDKVLVITLAQPLAAGEYTVDWTAVASDGHKTTGTYKVNVAQ
jgi:methionine-rich copper-binding protein CopC